MQEAGKCCLRIRVDLVHQVLLPSFMAYSSRERPVSATPSPPTFQQVAPPLHERGLAGPCLFNQSFLARGTTGSPSKKTLASAGPGTEIGGRLGCRSAAQDPARLVRLRLNPLNLAGRAR